MMTMLITDDSTQTRLGVAGVGKNRASDCRDGSCQGDLIATIATMSYHGNRNNGQNKPLSCGGFLNQFKE